MFINLVLRYYSVLKVISMPYPRTPLNFQSITRQYQQATGRGAISKFTLR